MRSDYQQREMCNKGHVVSRRKVQMGAFEQAGTIPVPAYLIVAPASIYDKTAQE
ncbi:hypothetical protein QWY85_12070 [Neolewinella lacunae]|uniref:Uncharacterized protein n=1 Tax=Neolewinella lacunae TaxID=1517758 RepID=A0A923PKJ1_9BACT|nr:hypothetical protein [Neolewinella lacunae]MBC6995054.1 hypothetical protein [Neolewinella lacunae]MDN3635399.1 hypothetical protein [Neolewinella lacunae]